MKKYFLIIFLFVTNLLYSNIESVCIIGEIINSGRKFDYFTLEKFQFSKQKRILLSQIKPVPGSDNNEYFTAEFACQTPQVVKLFYKDIFVKPGDTIKVKYFYRLDNQNQFWDSLSVDASYPLDIFFYEKLNKNVIANLPRYDDKKYLNDFYVYKKDIEEYYKNIFEYIKTERNSISDEFWKYLQKDLLFREMQMLCLPVEWDLISRNKLSADYFSLFNQLPENDNELLDMQSYCLALFLSNTLVNYDGNRDSLNYFQFANLLSSVSDTKTGPVRDYLIFAVSNWCFKKAEPETIRQIRNEIQKYLPDFTDTEYIRSIEENYPFLFAENNNIIKNEIEEILVRNHNGEVFSLKSIFSKFRKLTYLDVWSTSCPPCLKEIPVSLSLFKTKYQDDFRNIYFSLDDDFVKWSKMSTNLKIPSDRSFIFIKKADREIFEKYFNINSIPHCILIDDNLVINYRMPGASTLELLENELKYQQDKKQKKMNNLNVSPPPPPKIEGR